MRLLALCYDGLEAILIKKWGLRNIMQVLHGTYEAPCTKKLGMPYTPSAWATIFSGVELGKHSIDDRWIYNRILVKPRYLPVIRWIKNKRKILWKIGIKPRIVDRKMWETKNIFDNIKPSKPLFIPSINEPSLIHGEYNKAIKKGMEECIKKIREIHRCRMKTFMDELAKDDDWKLFTVWFDLTDMLSHIYISKCPDELRHTYTILDMLAYNARKRVSDNVVLITMLDHGMMPIKDGAGEHSYYGFWSLSIDIPWFKSRKAMDFFGLMVRPVSM